MKAVEPGVVGGLLALILLGAVAYIPAAGAGFVWDDNEHYVNNALTKAPDGLYRVWLDPDRTVWNYWPISRTSFVLEYRLFGIDPHVSHRINILLHLAAVCVLFLGLRSLSVRGAWFIAALFAVHPLCVESVAWVTERKNVLSGVFYLLTLWVYLHFDRRGGRRRYAAALLLYACALLSKSSTAVLPLVLVLCRVWLQRPWTRTDAVRLAPFFGLSGGSAVLSVVFERHYIGSAGVAAGGFLHDLAVAGRIPWFYLQKLIWPHPLSFNYPKWDIGTPGVVDYLPLAALVLIALPLVRYFGTWGRPGLAAFGAFLASVAPVLGFFEVYGMRFSYVADHWAYLASIPVLVLFGAGLTRALKRVPRSEIAVKAAILAVLGVLTWNQAGIYKDRETLWLDTIAKNPATPLGHVNLGIVYANEGRYEEALECFDRAVEVDPGEPRTFNNRGRIHLVAGNYSRAIEDFRRAIEIDPEYATPHANLARAYLDLGDLQEALRASEAALAIGGARSDYFYLRGRAREGLGDDRALEDYTRAIELNPGAAEPRRARRALVARLAE